MALAINLALVCVQLPQLCLTLCDYDPPGSSVHEDSPGRILEWVAMPSSRGSSGPRDRTHICISCTARGFFAAEPPGKPRDELFSAPNPDFSVPLASL